jgi:hypothetical protein
MNPSDRVRITIDATLDALLRAGASRQVIYEAAQAAATAFGKSLAEAGLRRVPAPIPDPADLSACEPQDTVVLTFHVPIPYSTPSIR